MSSYTTFQQNPKTVDLAGLHDFDALLLCQSQIGEANVFDSDMDENLRQADDEDSDHDDSEDSDFREWQSNGSEESKSFSLDEEDDLEPENESLDDIDLENDTQLLITSGHGSIDVDVGKNLLIGESALPALDPPFELRKRGRPEKHKRRESRLPIPL
ncbi:hypothetical protein Cgig2_009854 [Carnegiea gigantea]|uniref:Uncharacterized protein n=1 Tax=Carnegiea gigantea TaxID=171969 RepID=A0A9Q1KLP6_9CARY|nr:hypothetical protein Cgig2_009854 [Carnegiea gigantea]